YSADVVVVSCGAINSAALLLRSANDKHPHGLGNCSGVVGRHYMGHINSVLMAVSKCPNPTVFQKTLGVNDFYFRATELAFPSGRLYSAPISSVLSAVSKCATPTVFQKTLGVNDFYFGAKEFAFPMGHISF